MKSGRPPLKQYSHPETRMPYPEHDGDELPVMAQDGMKKPTSNRGGSDTSEGM